MLDGNLKYENLNFENWEPRLNPGRQPLLMFIGANRHNYPPLTLLMLLGVIYTSTYLSHLCQGLRSCNWSSRGQDYRPQAQNFHIKWFPNISDYDRTIFNTNNSNIINFCICDFEISKPKFTIILKSHFPDIPIPNL